MPKKLVPCSLAGLGLAVAARGAAVLAGFLALGFLGGGVFEAMRTS